MSSRVVDPGSPARVLIRFSPLLAVSLREFQGEEATDIYQEEKEEQAKIKKEEEQARAAAVPGMSASDLHLWQQVDQTN